jgi:uncharacterized protein Yka (UPF0111/DUF47 family)
MAQAPQDMFSKLADRGGDAIGRIADIPGAQKLIEQANTFKERMDEMQRKVRGIDDLERRVDALERKVYQLSKKPSTRTGAKKTTAKRTATKAKPKPMSS